jgi:prolyl-tRNA synthetase
VRITKSIFRTQRDDPSEAETASHRLLLRAGMIQQVASGVYAYGPLAQRSLMKIQAVIRDEMEKAGAQEVNLPVLQPAELWERSGRAVAFGPDLFRLADRRGREMVIAPTHEEVITLLAKHFVQSYRDLPRTLYQIQTKFRDEPRPRAGLMRVREFDMKDAYSFDQDEKGLDQTYQAMIRAYWNIFARCGLPVLMVEADSGAIGGKDSHEFILPSPVGEDVVVRCDTCGYAANIERAEARKSSIACDQQGILSEAHTPRATTIDAVAGFFGIKTSRTLKSVIYWIDGRVVLVVIRGDLGVSDIKVARALRAREVRLATDEEISRAGLVAGFASPVGLSGVTIVADDSIDLGNNFVAGANKVDYHFQNVNQGRDFKADVLTDVAIAQSGQSCRRCDGSLEMVTGIEVGHVFKLGRSFSEAFDFRFLDSEGHEKSPVMGCYGIGVGRLLAAAIEEQHDEAGMHLPPSIAAYQIYLATLNTEDSEVVRVADQVYEKLLVAGLEVLYDDRQESAGVKLKDADLLGFPVRLVVSPKTLRARSAEIRERKNNDISLVPLEDIVASVLGLLA